MIPFTVNYKRKSKSTMLINHRQERELKNDNDTFYCDWTSNFRVNNIAYFKLKIFSKLRVQLRVQFYIY